MTSNKAVGLALLVVGLVLTYFGWQSTESIGGQVSEAFTGRYSDETMLFIIGGVVAIAVGGFLLLRK